MLEVKGKEKKREERRKHLTHNQLKDFFLSIPPKRFRDSLMFSLTLYFGLRVSELTNIELEDIDFDNYGLVIQGAKGGRKKHYERIDSGLWRKLQKWIKVRVDLEYAKSNSFLFPSKTKYDKPVTEENVRLLFKKYARKANLDPKFSCHSLRFTCGTLNVEAGMGAGELTLWLRHSSAESTTVYYEQARFEKQPERVSKVFGKYM